MSNRKKFNRLAIASSDDYQRSRKMHQIMLDERHQHFSFLSISGEIKADLPIIKEGKVLPRYKTVRIFGKDMRVTIEEYREHNTLK